MNRINTTKVIILPLVLPALLFLFSGCIGPTDTKRTPDADNSKNKAGETRVVTTTPTESEPKEEEVKKEWTPPLENASERVTLKPFGIFVTPQDSPLEQERFSGYHTGTDFEILEGEKERGVPVKTVCSGELVQKRTASGYGGVVVQRCEIEGEPVTIIYGHLDIKSVEAEKGESLKTGERLGILGEGKSPETDGERKHLHLGLRQGEEVNIKGYVNSQEDLSDWLDPCRYICR